MPLWVSREVFADNSSTVDYQGGIHWFLLKFEKVQNSIADWENYDIENFCWHMNPDYFIALAILNQGIPPMPSFGQTDHLHVIE